MVCCRRHPVLRAGHSETRSWPTPMFTVTTVRTEWPGFRHPSVPSTVVTPLKHGSDESGSTVLPSSTVLQPAARGGGAEKRPPPPSLLDSEIVSPPALVTDEGWVILSRENARVPRPRQSSVGWVQSVAFKFRVPYVCGRTVHVCHL